MRSGGCGQVVTVAAATDFGMVDGLPVRQRLALAYAPKRARAATLALFALDARLAGIVRHSHEPMLAQLRLSWWREQVSRPDTDWPAGEPLLALLPAWNGRHGGLAALVDGWEAMTGAAPLGEDAFETMAGGRGAAFAALADALDQPAARDEAARAGRGWALADLSGRITRGDERAAVRALADGCDWRRPRLPRPLRPVAVLHALAVRDIGREDPAGPPRPADLLVAMRTGLLGR